MCVCEQRWAISGFAISIRYDINMRHQNLTPTRRDDIYETKTRPQRDETIFMRPKLDPNETPTIFGSYCVNDTIRYIVHIVDICRYSLNIPSIFPRYSLDIPSPSLPPSLRQTPTRPQRYLGHILLHQRDTNEKSRLKTPDISPQRYIYTIYI